MGFCKSLPDECLQKITKWTFAKVYQMGFGKRLPDGLLQNITRWALAKVYKIGFCKAISVASCGCVTLGQSDSEKDD